MIQCTCVASFCPSVALLLLSSLLYRTAYAPIAIGLLVPACCMLALLKPLSTLVLYGPNDMVIVTTLTSVSIVCVTLLYYDIPVTGRPDIIQLSCPMR